MPAQNEWKSEAEQLINRDIISNRMKFVVYDDAGLRRWLDTRMMPWRSNDLKGNSFACNARRPVASIKDGKN